MAKKIKAVFDVDETICKAINRDYANAIPKIDVIKKINYLHDELGYEIELYTSRGMVSCNGEIEKIKEKNEKILVEWLNKNDVHYDTLTFGKPIADFYVDDKGMSISDFMNNSFLELNGGSGKKVCKLGNIVKKEFGFEEDLINFQDWIENPKAKIYHPKVHSYLYDSVYMDYINGKTLANYQFDEMFLNVIIRIIDSFSNEKYCVFILERQLDILRKNRGFNKDVDEMIDFCVDELIKNNDILVKNASFSHGDMTLSNIIYNENEDKIYLIDPRYFRESSSYLLDYAKLKMSLDGYEFKFNIGNKVDKNWKKKLNLILKEKGIFKIVTLLELMYVLRLYRYKNDEQRTIVKKFAKKVKGKYEKLS